MKDYFERKKVIGFFCPTYEEAKEEFKEFAVKNAHWELFERGLEVLDTENKFTYMFIPITKQDYTKIAGLLFYQVHINPSVDTDLYSFIYSRVRW